MEFYVNGEKVDIILEQEKTVGDVLTSFEEEFAKNNATTIEIVLNGKQIPADKFDETCKLPLEEDTKLELSVISQEGIRAAFEEEADECTKLADRLLDVPAKFQSGKDKEANELIALLADFMDKFCYTVSLSRLFPDEFKDIKIDDKDFKDFFADFSQILSDFEQAILSKDTVLIGDLSEYEISPRLTAIAAAVKEL